MASLRCGTQCEGQGAGACGRIPCGGLTPEAKAEDGRQAMRVIAGRARGMRLECPSGDDVRPVPEMAREAIFNILSNEIEGAAALDLFAGAGTMGIEALSRGAEWCVFVERSARVRAVLEKNLSHTRLAEFCDVLQRDVFRCMEALARCGRVFEVVFVCPPFPLYREVGRREALAAFLGELGARGLLREEAQVIVQHEKSSGMEDNVPGLILAQQRVYGRNLISFYVPGGE